MKTVAIGVLSSALLAGTEGAAAGARWEYAVQRGDESGSQSVYARLRGGGPAYLWLACTKQVFEDERPPAITVSAAVAQRHYLGPSDERGRTTVYWFDDGAPETAPWIYKDKYGQLFGEERVKSFVASLMASQKLNIELSNYRFESIKLDFEIDPVETTAIAERFEKDCGALGRRPA